MSPWSPVCPVHVTPFSQADPAPGPDSSVKKVKKENPLVRTLLMTAFEVDDKLFQEYTKADIINDFLQKPIRLKDLRSAVMKHLISYKRNLKD